MLQIAKFALLFVIARLVGCSCLVIPVSYEAPIRASELRMLYKISTQGPGGFDDAVQMVLVKNAENYAQGVTRLLHSTVGSNDEEAGLYFAEYVTSNPEVRAELVALADRHQDSRTKDFVSLILGRSSGSGAEQGIQPDGPASGRPAG